MLNPAKTFINSPGLISSASISSNPENFIGYSLVKEGKIFKSNTPKYYPLRRPAAFREWTGDASHELTIRFRRDFRVYAETTNNFLCYQFSPVEIPYIDQKGNRKSYKPLALLTYWNDHLSIRNRKPLLMDVRCDEEIKENAETLLPAFRAAHRFAQIRKLKFQIFRDDFFRSDFFHNLLHIEQFCTLDPDSHNYKIIKQNLRSLGEIEFSKLVDRLSITDQQRELIERDLWILIQWGEIQVNWHERFTENTLLRVYN